MRIFLVLLFSFTMLLAGEKSVKDIQSEYNDYEKWHEYSGLLTLGLVGATVLTQWDRGIHEGLGTAAASTMVITSGLGILAHKDDVFDLTEGLKKEHWHAILGAIATVAMVATIAEAPEDSHAAFGVIGGITAGISFVVAKW